MAMVVAIAAVLNVAWRLAEQLSPDGGRGAFHLHSDPTNPPMFVRFHFTTALKACGPVARTFFFPQLLLAFSDCRFRKQMAESGKYSIIEQEPGGCFLSGRAGLVVENRVMGTNKEYREYKVIRGRNAH